MARQKSESVYRVTEIIGTSPVSWEDAAKVAVETAAQSLRDLRIAEVSKFDLTIDSGKGRRVQSESVLVVQVRSLNRRLSVASASGPSRPNG